MKKYPRIFIAVLAVAILIVASALLFLKSFKNRITVLNATLPEEIVFAKSSDDILNAGVVFNVKKELAKPTIIIWVHGWGVNFYSATYVSIGRAIGERGYTFVSVNTRMHDLANVEGYTAFGKRLRGGGYWGIASDQSKDISAWVDFAESNGFKKVILVGHSAGCAAVRNYLAEKQDSRVLGLVLASGTVDPDSPIDSSQYIQAVGLMSENKGEELIKDPKRSFPSYISAATLMDIASTQPEFKDFFGVHTTNPGVSKIQCPILAFYGTHDDVGNETQLELLKASIKKHSKNSISVSTIMIKGADHMYIGEEAQVADVITAWADTALKNKN